MEQRADSAAGSRVHGARKIGSVAKESASPAVLPLPTTQAANRTAGTAPCFNLKLGYRSSKLCTIRWNTLSTWKV